MQKVLKSKNERQQLLFLSASYKTAGQETSLKKYQQIKLALKELCYGRLNNTPFPSIRKVCKALEVSPVPVQRAITELIAEDILYVKSGIGLFIKRAPLKNPAKFSGHHTLRKVAELNFLYNDKLDNNRNLLLHALGKIREQHPAMATTRLIFEPDESAISDIAVFFDNTNEFLDVSDFAMHEIRKGNLAVEGKYGVMLSYITYYLYYNPELLDKLGLEPPAYTTFAEQKEYISQAREVLLKNGLQAPTSWNRPQNLLGSNTEKILKFLRGSEKWESSTSNEILDVLTKIMDYYKLYSYEGHLPNSALWYFMTGETPLFAGHTNCMMMPNATLHSPLNPTATPDFAYKAYPIFACDDTLPLQPVYATIDAKTRLPMECVNLLSMLQAESIQTEYLLQEYITVQRKGKYLSDNPVWERAAAESFSGYLEDSVDNYLFEHILDSELIECETREKDVRETFENIFHYSRGYMRNCAR